MQGLQFRILHFFTSTRHTYHNLHVMKTHATTAALAIVPWFILGIEAFSVPRPNIRSPTQLASTTTPASADALQSTNNDVESSKRTLGSQELLMLPRQYRPKLDKGEDAFPSMSHVSVTLLSATPSIEALSQAIEMAMDTHPLLRCHVEGDGEPDERIDLFQMVRKGEPNPCTFVAPNEKTFTSKDVLRVVDVDGTDTDALAKSWQDNFSTDIDDGSWYKNASNGPLWRLTLHRLNNGDGQSALVFASNHAISDQGTVNMLVDQMIADVASIEENGKVSNKAASQKMPMAMEDSVLGIEKRWSDVQTEGISPSTLKYVADKAAEGFRNPVILPDSEKAGDSTLSAITTIMGQSAGGEIEAERKTVLQFRTLSKETTAALLEACRTNGVTITNALTAAAALTSSDFIDGGDAKAGTKRNYKVLQSLDMRRFGAQLDKCDTVACMAGSNDLMLGPIQDRSGETVRSDPESSENQKLFWALSREGRMQTNKFVSSDGPVHAVRVFDFAMTISDMNNLVDLTARSKDSQGRAYSAGISNNGVYERQAAVKRDDTSERGNIQVRTTCVTLVSIVVNCTHTYSPNGVSNV